MRKIDRRTVALDDGSKIVALDEPEPTDHSQNYRYSNNVFRYAPDGTVVWQIDAGKPFDRPAPFTGIGFDKNGQLTAFRWDGEVFAIDVDTGKARYLYFAK